MSVVLTWVCCPVFQLDSLFSDLAKSVIRIPFWNGQLVVFGVKVFITI